MTNRVHNLLNVAELRKRTKGWILPEFKDISVDTKLTEIINYLRNLKRQKESVVLEIFRHRIGDYVGNELLTPLYKDEEKSELVVKEIIGKLNLEKLNDPYNLNIFNDIPAYRAKILDDSKKRYKIPKINEIEECFGKFFGIYKDGFIKDNLIKVLELIKELNNEPFSISELATRLNGENKISNALDIINILEKNISEFKLKTSVFVLLQKV